MASAENSLTDCPICCDGFEQPKLLPCAHLVCHKCVVKWLHTGGQNSCPICRASILPDDPKDMNDLDSQVEDLPTHLATALLAESIKKLSNEQCKCSCGQEACLYCLQCCLKMCEWCALTHAKFPTAQDHMVEKLDHLTAEQVASHHGVYCCVHNSVFADLYCTQHEQLVCTFCAKSSHLRCRGLNTLEEIIPVKRTQLNSLADKLQARVTAISVEEKEINRETEAGRQNFRAKKKEVKDVFDDLSVSLEKERQKVYKEIQEQKDKYLAERLAHVKDLQKIRARMSANGTTAKTLASSATNVALMCMTLKMEQRLKGLLAEKLPEFPKSARGWLTTFTPAADLAKKAMAAVLVLNDPQQDGPCCGWDLWCDKCRPEGTFRLTVDNISERKDSSEAEGRVCSPPYVIHGHSWELCVVPKVSSSGTTQEQRGLACYFTSKGGSGSTGPISWYRRAAVGIRLFHAQSGTWRDCTDWDSDYRRLTLITLENLNPCAGYVQDDKILVEVVIRPKAPRSV